MKSLHYFTFSVLLMINCTAEIGSFKNQPSLSADEFKTVLEHCETTLPKVWATLDRIRNQGVDVWLTNEKKMGPGKASGTSKIVINSRFLRHELPAYPEDRIVIVIAHEFGHILFNREKSKGPRDPVRNEFAAFSYSLQFARKLAAQGDFGPLAEVLKNLKIRAEKGKPKDPHTLAIKQLIGTPLWHESSALLVDAQPSL